MQWTNALQWRSTSYVSLMLDCIWFQHGKEILKTGSDFNSLKSQLSFFYDWTKGNGTVETQRYNSLEIKLATISHLSMQVSENYFSQDIAITPPPGETRRDKACSPLITQIYKVHNLNEP